MVIQSKPGSSGQRHEYEAQLTLAQGCWRQTAASIQDPELQIPTSIIWKEETLTNLFLFFEELPQGGRSAAACKGKGAWVWPR